MSPILGIWASQNYQRVAPDTGAMFPLGMVQGTGSVGTITFSSIPQTYKHLQLRILARGTSGAGGYYTALPITLNGDTTAGNYYNHALYGSGASASGLANSGYAENNLMSIPNGTNTANAFAAGIIDILDYTSTSKNKTIRSLNGVDLNGSGGVFLASMLWKKTPEAVTSITFTADATYSTYFASGSSFALYGIK